MITAYFDGACQPVNPGGVMGMGGVIYKGDEELFRFSTAKPQKSTNTNNVAEYMACVNVLHWLYNSNLIAQEIIIKSDSNMVVKQMSGEWNIGNGHYRRYAEKAEEYKGRFASIKFQWIPREENALADGLSKASLDELLTDFKPKSTGLKSEKPLKPKSSKQGRLEADYSKVLAEKAEEAQFCTGCGNTSGMLSPSHRIGRSNKKLFADPENIDYLCYSCHNKVEIGLWHELAIGGEIEAYVKKHDPLLCQRKINQGLIQSIFGRYASRNEENLLKAIAEVNKIERFKDVNIEYLIEEDLVKKIDNCSQVHWERKV